MWNKYTLYFILWFAFDDCMICNKDTRQYNIKKTNIWKDTCRFSFAHQCQKLRDYSGTILINAWKCDFEYYPKNILSNLLLLWLMLFFWFYSHCDENDSKIILPHRNLGPCTTSHVQLQLRQNGAGRCSSQPLQRANEQIAIRISGLSKSQFLWIPVSILLIKNSLKLFVQKLWIFRNPSPLSVPSPLSNVASPLGNIAVTTQASPTYSLLQPVQAINVPHTSPNMMAGSTYLDLNNLSQGPVIHQQQAVEQPQQFNDFPFPDAGEFIFHFWKSIKSSTEYFIAQFQWICLWVMQVMSVLPICWRTTIIRTTAKSVWQPWKTFWAFRRFWATFHSLKSRR